MSTCPGRTDFLVVIKLYLILFAFIKVGDDVFGEDPTINELETRVANMFGKESSLFFPSGTMSNLAAVMSWCGTRGSEMILGDSSHIHLFEQVVLKYELSKHFV